MLNRVFHSSFAVGKRVRTETGLGAGAVSVSYAAVALARKIFGDLSGMSVAVVGAGEMGKLTAMHMKSQGVQHVTILSRTMAHAARTAEAIGGATAAPWEDIDAVLGASDIVITATGAAAPILTKARVESVMRPRRNRPLFVIDIAMPRDVEPAAGEIEQVFLYNIDDLQATVRENLARRASEVSRAEAIVTDEVQKFAGWLRSRSAIPTVVALRQRFEAIRRAELDRLDFKLSALPPEARARVDEITHLIVEKLLLTPTEQLKSVTDADTAGAYSDALTRLFGLGDADRDAPRPRRAQGRAVHSQQTTLVADLRLGTRGSQLALWQARAVAARLEGAGGHACRIVVIKTSGDQLQEAPLSDIGGKRLFVKEIEDALLRGEIDLAVHSSKDMPVVLPDGLEIGAVLPREDPRDAVVLPVRLKADPTYVSESHETLSPSSVGSGSPSYVGSGFSRTLKTIDDLVAALGQSPSIGTGSVRRVAQLTRLLPGARFSPIRGNLDTRLRKLDEGQHDALVLAAAGLRRLGFASRIALALPAEACVPAPGQGIVAIEIRAGDDRVRSAVAAIDDRDAAVALTAERAVIEALGGGCQTPVGALATLGAADTLEIVAIVVALDGSEAVHGRVAGPRAAAAALGRRLGGQLLADGAGQILAQAQTNPWRC